MLCSVKRKLVKVMKLIDNGLFYKIISWFGLEYTGEFTSDYEFFIFFGLSCLSVVIFFLIVFALLRSLTDIAKGVRM